MKDMYGCRPVFSLHSGHERLYRTVISGDMSLHVSGRHENCIDRARVPLLVDNYPGGMNT